MVPTLINYFDLECGEMLKQLASTVGMYSCQALVDVHVDYYLRRNAKDAQFLQRAAA